MYNTCSINVHPLSGEHAKHPTLGISCCAITVLCVLGDVSGLGVVRQKSPGTLEGIMLVIRGVHKPYIMSAFDWFNL